MLQQNPQFGQFPVTEPGLLSKKVLHFVKKPVVAGILVFSVLLLLVIAFSLQRLYNFRNNQKQQLQQAAYTAKAKLEKALNNSLSATKTLSFIATSYKVDKDFDLLAQKILDNNRFIDAVELVQGGIITHVYPYKGNEKAIGYDILKDTLRNKEAMKAARENELYFAGPFSLRQGYTGVVGRLPIFVEGKLWGFSAVIIKLPTLIRAAEMDSSFSSAYVFQLSKTNPNTGKEEFFLPHPEHFTKKESVIVEVPNGGWKIYARFAKPQRPNNLISLLLLGILFSCTGGFFVWFIARQPLVLKKLVDERTAQLKQSEEKFRSLVEQNLVGVFIIQDEKLSYSNPGFINMIGYSQQELLYDVKIEDFVHPDDFEKVKQNYEQRLHGISSTSQYIIRLIRKDRVILHIEIIASAIMYENKPSVIVTCIDITRRMEEEKRISKAVADAQERERMQIGMELHDNVKQILAASLLNLGIIQNEFDDKEIVMERIDQLKLYMNEAIYELRRLSHQLAPSLDSSVTLSEKVNTLVHSMLTSSKLKVTVDVDEFSGEMNNDIQRAVYRILQEQVGNTLKHAGAAEIMISIKKKGNLVEIVVKDNGKGFNQALKKEGIGLENIRRRAQALDGTVKIITSPGYGFELQVEIPLTV
ncbi:MAG: PAS domain S-box protein [Lacibacter sp.]